MIAILLTLLTFLSVEGIASNSKPTLAPGMHKAELFFFEGDPKYNGLLEKYRKGMAKNPEWYEGYVKKHSGKKLPWHPKMGLTKQEYKRMDQAGYSAQFGHRIRFLPVGESARYRSPFPMIAVIGCLT